MRKLDLLMTVFVLVRTISSITAALAGALHALFQPIVSPDVASLGITILALLMILWIQQPKNLS